MHEVNDGADEAGDDEKGQDDDGGNLGRAPAVNHGERVGRDVRGGQRAHRGRRTDQIHFTPPTPAHGSSCTTTHELPQLAIYHTRSKHR